MRSITAVEVVQLGGSAVAVEVARQPGRVVEVVQLGRVEAVAVQLRV